MYTQVEFEAVIFGHVVCSCLKCLAVNYSDEPCLIRKKYHGYEMMRAANQTTCLVGLRTVMLFIKKPSVDECHLCH